MKIDDDKKLTSSDPNESPKEPIQIHTTYDENTITWRDTNNQAQSVDSLCLKVDIDTLLSEAIFRLSCSILLKYKGKTKSKTKVKTRTKAKGSEVEAGKKQSVYLYMHPEDIRAIALDFDDDVPSLRFSMSRNPHLVIPSDQVVECREEKLPQLDAMKALSKADDFTIRLNMSNKTKSTHEHLQQIALIFSLTNTNRPGKDERRANLRTLYGGIGGEVFDMNMAVANTCDKEGQLPTYDKSPHRRITQKRAHKRKRGCESSDTDIECSPTTRDNPFTKDFQTRSDDQQDLTKIIDHMENRLRNHFNNTVDGMENRLRNYFDNTMDSMENRLRNDLNNIVDDGIKRLENAFVDELTATHCRSRSGTEDIDRQVYTAVDNLRSECIDTITTGFKDIKYEVEEVTKCMEQVEEQTKDVMGLWGEAGGEMEKLIGRCLEGIRFQVTVDK
ncbi:hypothetical protein V8C37DRAFT_359064 [Trichoderma ceciliae]